MAHALPRAPLVYRLNPSSGNPDLRLVATQLDWAPGDHPAVGNPETTYKLQYLENKAKQHAGPHLHRDINVLLQVYFTP